MRVVIDTNSLLVSIGNQSRYRPIFDALISGKFTLVLSNDILSEYREVLERRTTAFIADNICDFLIQSPDVERVNVHFKWNVIYIDKDDNKFVDCAMNGNVRMIVTDDKHFNVLKRVRFPGIKIMRTAAFLDLLTSNTL